jgi:hypothetical protein
MIEMPVGDHQYVELRQPRHNDVSQRVYLFDTLAMWINEHWIDENSDIRRGDEKRSVADELYLHLELAHGFRTRALGLHKYISTASETVHHSAADTATIKPNPALGLVICKSPLRNEIPSTQQKKPSKWNNPSRLNYLTFATSSVKIEAVNLLRSDGGFDDCCGAAGSSF